MWASKQDRPRFPSSPRDLAYLGIGLVLYAAATLLRGARWDVILRCDRVGHRRVDAFALVPVGYMGNNVLPARGGELLCVFLLGQRSSARRREILGSILAERLVDAVVLAGLFAILTWIGVAGAPAGAVAAAVGAAVIALSLVAALVYLRLRRAGRFANTVRPLVRASRPVGVALVGVTTVVWMIEAFIFALWSRAPWDCTCRSSKAYSST